MRDYPTRKVHTLPDSFYGVMGQIILTRGMQPGNDLLLVAPGGFFPADCPSKMRLVAPRVSSALRRWPSPE
jgi:hypothetical protein